MNGRRFQVPDSKQINSTKKIKRAQKVSTKMLRNGIINSEQLYNAWSQSNESGYLSIIGFVFKGNKGSKRRSIRNSITVFEWDTGEAWRHLRDRRAVTATFEGVMGEF